MKLRIVLTTISLLLGGVTATAWSGEAEPSPQPSPVLSVDLAPLPPRYATSSHEVVEGETGSEVLRALGVDGQAVLSAAGRRLDRLSIGDVFHVDTRDGEPWRIRLEGSGPTMFQLDWDGKKYTGSERPIPYKIASGAREMVVTSSLWDAGLEAGMRPSQIVGVAKIFEYDVDFNTELQAGARIRLVADTLVAEDGSEHVGDVRAARLDNANKSYSAIRFTLSDGSTGWFAPDGTGRRRTLLRSPLEFSRVTSGFSTGRYHPILKVKRPHNGVDFGAPTGTPVRSAADGVVTTAGVSGGHGNYVHIDHDGPYETSYSHLSKILVKRGQRVRQGDVIGRVGATGLATGPHLHYQLWVDGQYRDPMKVEVPTTAMLPESEKEAFFAVRDQLLPQLEGQI